MRDGYDLTTGPIPVGQFVNLVRNTLRHDKLFQNQVITGEITQWKRHSNGHTYFTLIDSDGQISAVIWQGRCAIDPLIEEGSVVGAGSVITKNVKRKSLALTRSLQTEIKNYKRKSK